MKGVILAAGKATRLYPVTYSIPKPLLPIYDKPMIFYPLSVLLEVGIDDITIVVSEEGLSLFKKLFSFYKDLNFKINFVVQKERKGIAHALIIAKEYIKGDNVALILGDNIFYGGMFHSYLADLKNKLTNFTGATVFGYYVDDPSRFGVAEFDGNKLIGIEEKPQNPKSNYAITGLYFLDKKALSFAEKLKPSARGELEITDLLNYYVKNNEINIYLLERDTLWLDTGTFDDLYKATKIIYEHVKQGENIGDITKFYQNQNFLKNNLV